MSSIVCQAWCESVWDHASINWPTTRIRAATADSKASDLCRIRVGNYRIVYGINDDERLIVVTAVRHRSRAYRGLR